MRIGLSALSFSYRCGIMGRGSERAISEPMGFDGLFALAEHAGLASLAAPTSMFSLAEPARLAAIRERLHRCGMALILDSEVIEVERVRAELLLAAALGVKTLRLLISPALEGGRATLEQPWAFYLQAAVEQLRVLCPLAHELGVELAIENHQDATSTDLIAICDAVDHAALGVTFDPVNAITVAEEPFAALERLGPRIRCLHLADYFVFHSPLGIRLVRCALGEGDFNIRRLFELVKQVAPQAPCQIELFAHTARHIQWFTDEWWTGYAPQDIRELLPLFRRVAATIRPMSEEWRTPWERGAEAEAVLIYEEQQFASSVAHLRSVGILPKS